MKNDGNKKMFSLLGDFKLAINKRKSKMIVLVRDEIDHFLNQGNNISTELRDQYKQLIAISNNILIKNRKKCTKK